MPVNQLKAGAALSYLVIVLNIVIGLVYTPYMLRSLGANEYGLYSLVASVVSYLTVLDLGFGNAIVRYTAKFRAENDVKGQYQMFGMFLILYSAIGLVAIIAGCLLLNNVDLLFEATMSADDLYKVRIMMVLMVFNIAFTFPMSIWGSIISAYENFVFVRLVNIIRVVLNPVVMVILLAIGYKTIAMVVVTTLFNILSLSANAWFCFKKLHIRIEFGKFKWGFLKEVSIYSFWIFLNCIMDRIYWSTGQFVLGMFWGATVVAVYAVAIQLEHMYMMFSTAISNVFLPKVTAMVVKGNNEREISNLFIRSGRIQYIVMAFVLTGFIVFGHSFVVLWAGADYSDAYWIALCFFVPLTVPLIQNLGITILQARNQMKFRSILYVVIAIASLGISVPLAKMYGGIGCAVGTSTALILGQIIIMNVYYHHKIKIDIPRFWREIIKMSVVPSVLTVVFLFAFHEFHLVDSLPSLIVSVIVFIVCYGVLFWKFAMNDYERNLFAAPVKNIISHIK